MHRVFVYGSLMRGFGNHGLLKNQAFISNASVEGFDLHSLGAFPAVVYSDDDHALVRGEVYEVDDEALAKLDRLEGHPHFYERHNVMAWADNLNAHLPAQLYVFQHDVNAPVPDGDWREYKCNPDTRLCPTG